jgi:lauroyl/myristoyl acyltransferase
VTQPEHRLEAPHRRTGTGPGRLVERSAVVGYRAAAWLLGVVPEPIGRTVIGGLTQGSYLAWPAKRRWSNRNFGHVLGLPPDDPRVRRLALRAYREYGRYLVELMRLPGLPHETVGQLVPEFDIQEIKDIWHGSPGGGLILTVGHMGSNEVIAASIANHGMPISVVADDSSFPELFELLRRQREHWSVTLVPWRNLRAIFGVLRRGEVLGLLVDWGYRSDGIPVTLFGAWTTLPAGPATLAAKTRARILPIAIRRTADGTFAVSWDVPIEVASSDPAELQRATQAMADALTASIGAAPEQWYSFKPIWPASADEAADLEHRAREMQAGRPDPGPARGLARDAADHVAAAAEAPV